MQELFFRRFCNKDRLFLWFHPRIHKNSRIFWDEDLFFSWSSPQISWKFAFFLDKDQISWNFSYFLRRRPFFFFFGLYLIFRRISRWTPLFFGPHLRVQKNKVPPKFVYALPSHAILVPGLKIYDAAARNRNYQKYELVRLQWRKKFRLSFIILDYFDVVKILMSSKLTFPQYSSLYYNMLKIRSYLTKFGLGTNSQTSKSFCNILYL